MAQHRYVIVDVFTDTPFAGNPLAVFTDARRLTEAAMGRIANELNLSETAFVLPKEGDGDARLRIFTPRTELPFAGHPVCGAAWVIGRAVHLGQLLLETGVGVLPVVLERVDGQLSRVVMTQPRPSFTPADDPDAIAAALRLDALPEPPVVGDNGLRVLLVQAPSLDVLTALEPDLAAVARLGFDTVSVFAEDGGDVRARVFAPAVGVPEDPATGSAAGPLGALLVERGLRPPGTIAIRQGVEMGRPSLLEVEVDESGEVRVGGACVVIGRGALEA